MTAKAKKNTGGPPSNRSRILSLTARNVKRIREVSIDEMGDIVEIRGDADQGKTSILDAIEGALSGLDRSMVRRGADKAELELVLSDATVQRIIGADPDSKEILMVTGADGKAVDRAKDFLKTICGGTAFRPLSWVQLGGGAGKGATERRRMQRDQLLESLNVSLGAEKVMEIIARRLGDDHVEAMDQINLDGVDFEGHPFVVCRALLEASREFYKLKHAEEERAEEARRHTPAPVIQAPKTDLATLRARADAATRAYHEANALNTAAAGIIERRDTLAAKVAAPDDLPDASKVAAAREKYTGIEAEKRAEIERLEAELAEAQAGLGKAREALRKCDDAERRLQRHQADLDELADLEARLENQQVQDVAALAEAERRAKELAQARELQDRHDAASAALAAASETAARYKDLVKLFRDGIPQQLLEEADLPVDGLTVDDDGILIDGVPLHQLGTSRQIRLGVLIAHALNPRSAFVLVDGAESMGQSDRKALADTAAELGLQLIMTFVDPVAVPGVGVTVMRDGEAVA